MTKHEVISLMKEHESMTDQDPERFMLDEEEQMIKAISEVLSQ